MSFEKSENSVVVVSRFFRSSFFVVGGAILYWMGRLPFAVEVLINILFVWFGGVLWLPGLTGKWI